MQDLSAENKILNQIMLIKKYLKIKIIEDKVSFRGHAEERHHIYDLMKRTVVNGESHSALISGHQGSGKTTLVNSVLHQLAKETDLKEDAIIVKLNGVIHSDEKVALRDITAQMQLENAVGDRVFGTVAENLAFLLSCLQSGVDRRCKSMLFVLDEVDLFCETGRMQTLLYALFDITHSRKSPMCVLGITNRRDVMELFEKRVKSRFSHRHVKLLPVPENQSPVEYYIQVLIQLLSMPVRKSVEKRKRKSTSVSRSTDQQPSDVEFSVPVEVLEKCSVKQSKFDALVPTIMADWNSHIAALANDDKVIDAVEKFCYYSVNEQIFRNILFQVVCKLRPSAPFIDSEVLSSAIYNTVSPEHKVKHLHSLSVLQLSLVVAMKHALDIFDNQPMNFEMVLHRYTKFANTNSSTQTVPRPVILKAFEGLEALEIIMPVKNTDNNETTASRVQKEYKLYTLAALEETITDAIKTFKALPTEITHWYNNSIV